jgi:hypothetical protein
MSHLPLPIIAFFLLTTLLALIAFGKAVRGSKIAIAFIVPTAIFCHLVVFWKAGDKHDR